MLENFANPSPSVSSLATIGDGVKIWAGSQIREYAVVEEGTSIGQYCYVGPGVRIGQNCSILNKAQIFEPAELAYAVFIGPGAILENDSNPRAINDLGSRKTPSEWTAEGVRVGKGASIGARAVCIGGIVIGEWAMVGAGAVVTKNVANFALMAGVPARQVGWVGRRGFRLEEVSLGKFKCPSSGDLYEIQSAKLVPVNPRLDGV